MMKVKYKIITIISIMLFFLLGAAPKMVELRDSDPIKLINLDKAIEFAKPGGSWNPQESKSDEETRIEEQDIAEQKSKDSEKDSIEDEEIVISVNGDKITYKGNDIKDIEELRFNIERDASANVKFSLEDDFAQAQLFKSIINLLNEEEVVYSLY